MPPGRAPGGHAPRFGARVGKEGIRFAVWSGAAERVWLALFDASGEEETARLEMARAADGTFSLTVPGLKAGTRYGFRADGPYAPERGLWFDPEKLLVDPYAVEIDRPFAYSPELSRRRGEGGDTAKLVPKAIAWAAPEPVSMGSPLFEPGGFIYELSVRAFTMRHPDIEEKIRGTIGALAHPAAIRHLKKIGVSAVELMPVTAWIDERHLPPLGLSNSWGYNPVTLMALDPRLAPGGVAELRATVAALREAGIGTILDLVFNHTGESDAQGPTLSMRGLDSLAYYRHQGDGPVHLVNDTGTGNTLACDHPIVEELVLDALAPFRPQRRRRRLPLRPGPGARTHRGWVRPQGKPAAGDPQRPGAEGPGDDRRAMGYRPWRLPARQFSERVPRVERQVPRRHQALLARRPRHGRRAGDAARGFVGRLSPPQCAEVKERQLHRRA